MSLRSKQNTVHFQIVLLIGGVELSFVPALKNS
jgi:hypothetical protein